MSELSPWLVTIVVLTAIAAGFLVAWYFLARRPKKLDPRHERLVQSMVRLQQQSPYEASDLIARALVRAGLIWEADLQATRSDSPEAGRGSQERPRRGRPDRSQGQRRQSGGRNTSEASKSEDGRGQSRSPQAQRSPKPNEQSRRSGAQASEAKSSEARGEASGPARDTEQGRSEGGDDQAKRPRRRRRRRSPSKPQSPSTNEPQSRSNESTESTE